MEPKIIKEEVIERDSNILDEPTVNNNNNKESAFRIHTRKSKVKSKDTSFSSTSTSDSSGEHLLSPTTHQLPVHIDVESESLSPRSDTFRNHSKLKRFLSTLVQFSGQISSQTSERVKGQIFTLVNNLISVEEFHHNIQEMTNFPLRPFVLPFLKSHLPSLQRDLLSMARNNKQTLSQYLKQHENAYLDRDSQPSEPSEIFHQVERVPPPPPSPMPIRDNNVAASSNKRPYPLSAATAMSAMADGYYEAGYAADLDYQQPFVKRPNLSYAVPFMYHHPHMHPQEPPPPSAPPSQPLPPPPPSHPFNVLPMLHIRETEDHKGHVEDEWKNIHVMLNCILSMVEKTKKALGILQERGLTETHFSDWNRKRTTEEILSLTVRQTEERIENIKKKAEDSMNEIRHQAMIELQKLVLAAENKMIELVASERTRMNGNKTSGANLQISPSLITQYNSCWNCGRKAHETCSGCNTAQYCSSFCQHKDWEAHHQTCCVHSATTAVHQQQPQAAAATSPAGKKQQPPPSVGSSSSDDPSAAGHRQSTTAGPLSLKMSSGVSVTDISDSAVDKQCNNKIGQQSSPPLANATATTTVTTTTTTTTTAIANGGSDIGGGGSDGGRQQ